MIHFFHPLSVNRGGASTFMCQDEPTGSAFGCEAIGKTALDLGVVTSLEVVHSADQGEMRATFGSR